MTEPGTISALAVDWTDALRPSPNGDSTVAQLPATRADLLRAQLKDSAGLDEMPDPVPLIDGILFRDSLSWLHGKPGSAKSFIALDWAACVSLGLPWQGCEVKQGPVLYIIAEGVTGMRQRKQAWEHLAGYRMDVTFLPVPVQIAQPPDMYAMIELVEELEPAMIVYDTQARVAVGLDENSATDMGRFISAADEIRKASGACCLFVHHESRAGENMRGSTALEGAATTAIRAVKDGLHITLSNPKQKDAAEFEPIHLGLKPHANSAVIVSPDRETFGLQNAEKLIMDAFRETFGETIAVSRSDIEDITRLSKSTCCRALNALVKSCLLANVGTEKRPMYQTPKRSQ